MMVTINSGSNPQIKEIVKLQKSARERKKKQMFVVEGYKLAGEAASSGRLRKLYLSESAVAECRAGEHWDTLGQYPHEVVADAVFRGMSDTVTPQGILGLAEMPCYSLDDILQDRRRSILLLDDLRDPGNLGTIMRTAEGADMSGVILSRESVDLFNPKVVRSTMGAIFRVPFYYAEDLALAAGKVRQGGIPLYGMMMQGSILYTEADYRMGAAVVIGNEANGISEPIAALCEGVRIPMAGKLESLNAAVSAAIMMYEVFRQRCL